MYTYAYTYTYIHTYICLYIYTYECTPASRASSSPLDNVSSNFMTTSTGTTDNEKFVGARIYINMNVHLQVENRAQL